MLGEILNKSTQQLGEISILVVIHFLVLIVIIVNLRCKIEAKEAIILYVVFYDNRNFVT